MVKIMVSPFGVVCERLFLRSWNRSRHQWWRLWFDCLAALLKTLAKLKPVFPYGHLWYICKKSWFGKDQFLEFGFALVLLFLGDILPMHPTTLTNLITSFHSCIRIVIFICNDAKLSFRSPILVGFGKPNSQWKHHLLGTKVPNWTYWVEF